VFSAEKRGELRNATVIQVRKRTEQDREMCDLETTETAYLFPLASWKATTTARGKVNIDFQPKWKDKRCENGIV
jgi:hypothetical protein